ncbi:GNAT family N-acetyltransferase [Rhodovarius crocodyli]|uniref:GNAT family N-acetyltransferase n=1 Tax=Rhodovarius crocodyli TaxID=1979269 RepID=A0A437MPK8_9PROT|nr:GNAT family N-acetyltransferase [Rhodovarius crocodyli]RVT99579.1 GNAT family N-acetyltransferase [Rhodovarius crocodyli]
MLRRLTAPDAEAFRDIRLRGLREDPGSFGRAWEEEADQPLSFFADRLARHPVLGAGDGRLVATAALVREAGLRQCHKAQLSGLYVAPEARGQGLAARMLRQLIWHAADCGVFDIRLTTRADDTPAVALYRKLGFAVYGQEPRATLLGGEYLGTYLMALHLDDAWFSNPRPEAIPGLCPPPSASP